MKNKLLEKLLKLERLLRESVREFDWKSRVQKYREYMKTSEGQELKKLWQEAKSIYYTSPEISTWRTPYLLFIGMALQKGFTKKDIFEFLSALEYWTELDFEELWQLYKEGYLK